ncbi:MAG: serine hydroxymethyltransferase [Candidatus Thermoplasmatota archaeon]|jgi:glycine hydroxymethyltransferase|nr:serine hydroxymethyltransferase [Candidatus Thermoplasmatota archaeon]MCL5786033.1 serine hydroxymethyltransferase [Candidatus Thermoplasmatota archaeon]
MGNPRESALKIRDMARRHNRLFGDSIPLIASENIMSPLAMEMLLTDFGSRYAEGLPHQRYYQGNQIVDEMEEYATELLRRLFGSRFADPRPISGTVANMGVIYGLTKVGDPITVPDLSGGGHISAAKFGAVGFRGLDASPYPFDPDTMSIDPDGARKLILEKKPKVALFGQSVFLFPAPLKELSDTFQEVGCRVWYDAAHVLGLIAGGKFQDPLREGAEIVSGSTHKTFPGPQHGVVLGQSDETVWKHVQRGLFPGVLSNHHLNTMAALAVTTAEEMEFGRKYASDIVDNAQALAEELHSLGFRVLGEKRGFTESHTIAADVSEMGGGKEVAEKLERCGIILNKNLLPGDQGKKSQDPSGIRIGVQEITRLGMGKSEMKEIASLIHRAITKNVTDREISESAAGLKRQFPEVRYCFGKLHAYEYPEFAKGI